MDDISYIIIGIPIAVIFGWLLIRFMYGPIFVYEKIKKIFKIKDGSNIDNILIFITGMVILGVLAFLFPL
tara:strand:+ start:291 stop:500 length:210 start_codon:yes stop_codon:yes gene_type:complete